MKLYRGNVGAVIDYLVTNLDLSTATSVSFRYLSPKRETGTLSAVVLPDHKTIRRVLAGTELTRLGTYKFWPSVVSPSFSGEGEPFSVDVVDLT